MNPDTAASPDHRPRVLVTRRIHEAGLQQLGEHTRLEVWDGAMPPSREELLRRAEGCEGLVTLLSDRVDGELLDRAGPQLKVVCNYAVGFNNIDVQAAAQRDVAVGNTPDVLTDATADLAVALLLAAARRLPEAIDQVRQGRWKTWEPLGLLGVDLVGKTLGIVGMGRIGLATAQRLHAGWGMRVLYTARDPKPDADSRLDARHVDLPTLLASSDFVSIHCPLTEQTAGLIDAEALARMPQHAVLVNTARGEVVDQDALAAALEKRQIFAAGLDVTTPEPLPPEHPLVGLDNCVIAPHIGSASQDSRRRMSEIAAQNVLAGLRGEPLPHPVSTGEAG
ncbi:2-hydroxyacid dehydrogenase [Roseimaritima sediminicola]|uniref:2-hydroxyacid dehydrogenase n=1 Tax=Roseimaritima sediminicola TaxID=2662066 RepID=UPI0012985516|nr:D-glycerate dehydrogenase [Roseimaritima sediminicola]